MTSIVKRKMKAREMAAQLRVFAALAEDPGLDQDPLSGLGPTQ